jgi:hypothetical protein
MGRSASTEVVCFCHLAGDRIAALWLLAAIDIDDRASG